MSVVEVVQHVLAMGCSYSFESDRSVFSLCQLCGTFTYLDVIGVCSTCVSYVGSLLLWM